MFKRRAIAGLVGVAAASLLFVAPVGAQTDDEVSPPTVLDTTTVPDAPTTTVQVGGVVQTQPLPQTGGDLGPEVLVGIALTGSGIALAVGARRRRARHAA